MSFILSAVAKSRLKADPREVQINNLKRRIEGAGEDYGKPTQPLLTRALDAALLPSRLQGQALGKLTGYGGDDVKSAVSNLLTQGLGVPGDPLFRAKIPWFGGGLEIAPSIPGIVGTLADAFNPADPINWLTLGIGDDIAKGAGKLVQKGMKEGSEKTLKEAIEMAGKAAPKSKPLYIGLKSPLAKAGTGRPLLSFEPGSLLGPARGPVSNVLTGALDKAAGSDVGVALARRFGTGMAASKMPKTLTTDDGLQGLRLFRQSVAETVGDERILKTLDVIQETMGKAFKSGNLTAAEAARQTSNAFSLLENVRAGAAKILSENWAHELSMFTEAQRNTMRKALAQVVDGSGSPIFDAMAPNMQSAVVKMRDTMTNLHKYTAEAGGRIDPLLAKKIREGAPGIDPMRYVPRVKADGYPKELLAAAERSGISKAALEAMGPEDLDKIFIKLGHINQSMNPRSLFPHMSDPQAINEMITKAFPEYGKKVFQDDLLEIIPKHVGQQLSGIGYLDSLKGVTETYNMGFEEAKKLLKNASPGEAGKWGYYTIQGNPGKEGLQYVLDTSSERAIQRLVAGGDPFAEAAKAAAAGGKAVEDAAQAARKVLIPHEVAQYANAAYKATMQPAWARDGIGKAYQTWMRFFKTGTTLPFPGYWARNKLGDMWLMWLGGVDFTSTKAMTQAADILRSKDLTKIMVNVGGSPMDARTLMDSLEGMGALQGFHDANVRAGAGAMSDYFKGRAAKLGKGLDAVEDLGRTWVNHHSRLWMVLDRLNKGTDLHTAAADTLKHLFNFTQLTGFEKTVMRPLIPFYSWMRNNIPFEIEQLIKQPGKFTTMRKWQKNLSQPGFEDEMPLWMKENMPIGAQKASGEGLNFVMPRLPYEDLGRFFNPSGTPNLGEITGSMSPVLRLLFEGATNQNLATGVPIKDRGESSLEAWLPYALRQVLPRIATTPFDVFTATTGVEIPGMTTEQAQRRIATSMTPFSAYPSDKAKGSANWEELERLLDLMARYEKKGKKIPTLQELGLR